MTNFEKQANEILALQSIFDKKFHLFDQNQYEILVDFDVSTPFIVRLGNKKSVVQYLPPLSLTIQYHDRYPSNDPPSFILSCFYFSRPDLINLCQKLDQFPFIAEKVCVYDWIELIKEEIHDELVLHQASVQSENDPRALNAYTSDDVERIFQNLIDHNQRCEEKLFQNQLQTCSICTDMIPGEHCIRLHRCKHFYCRPCLDHFIRMTFDNGKFGENLYCPQNQCKQTLLPTEVKKAIQSEELFERYERLTLQHGLESMGDITWCPRCQSPVISGSDNDKLCICSECLFTFCKKCRETYHSQTLCREELMEQMRLQKLKELERLRHEKEAAVAELAKIKEEKRTLEERKIAKQKYRQIIIKLSEQDHLLQEILSSDRISSSDIQQCPNCHVAIEKNGGCSHMYCVRCNSHFTWQCQSEPKSSAIAATLGTIDHPDVATIAKEFNKVVQAAQTPVQNALTNKKEIDSTLTNDNENPSDDDLKITVDNRSALGSIIVNRIRKCPSQSCQKLNVKVTDDNWIICSVCVTQFCFLCGHKINGIKHFDKKCQRRTPF